MTRRPRRAGVTLMEVMIATAILGIGALAIMALFPIGAVNMARAINQNRAADHAQNCDAIFRLYENEVVRGSEPRYYEDVEVGEQLGAGVEAALAAGVVVGAVLAHHGAVGRYRVDAQRADVDDAGDAGGTRRVDEGDGGGDVGGLELLPLASGGHAGTGVHHRVDAALDVTDFSCPMLGAEDDPARW